MSATYRCHWCGRVRDFSDGFDLIFVAGTGNVPVCKGGCP